MVNTVSLIIVFLSALTSIVQSSEEATLLEEIAEQYSYPMVIAFLHERIRINRETITKVKSNLNNLDKSVLDKFNYAEKSLTLLDQHLTAMEKADYFDYHGAEKIKIFMDQFNMSIEMFPVKLDVEAALKMTNTVDQLITTLPAKSNDLSINQTRETIKMYMNDMEEKETSADSNRIQKLSASLAKAKLQLLADHSYSNVQRNSRCDTDYYYRQNYDCSKVDKRQNEILEVLRQLKQIVDLFYAKFNHLVGPVQPKRSKIILKKQKTRPEPTPTAKNNTTTSTSTTVSPEDLMEPLISTGDSPLTDFSDD